MNVLPKFLKGEDKMERTTAPMPPAPIPLKRRPLSEAAAQAAQHVDDLEKDLAHALQELGAARAYIQVLEERVKMIQSDNAMLVKDRDYHKELHDKIRNSLQNCGSILLSVMNDEVKSKDTIAREMTIEKSLADVEQIIVGPKNVVFNEASAEVEVEQLARTSPPPIR